jgi:adenosylmethionine-8-amino-7-oxononanoate aminotransferase
MHFYPRGNVFYRRLTKPFPRIVQGEGCWLEDADGKRYLDACGGAFVACLGHGNREIAAAMAEQAGRIAYVNGTAFTSDPVEQLAGELAKTLPGDLDHLYFLSSGSEAVEAALKLARQYWAERGLPAKRKILALSAAYHGNTLLALSASAREHYKTYVHDWLVDVIRVPVPCFQCACRGDDPTCATCTGNALEAAIERAGPDTVAAFIAEPVGGSSTGAAVPRAEYFRTVREICDRHQVLFIADEVLCGAGRTGTWWAIEPFGVVPDLMTLGKGIAAGYAPLSAVAAPRRIIDILAQGAGSLFHAQTFSFHPVACAAGLATVRYLRAHGLVERCAELGAAFHRKLAGLTSLPNVGAVRGRGLLAGIEFVEDTKVGTPLPRALRFAETFAEQALAVGLVVWPNVGHVDGTQGDLVMLAPPFIVTEVELDEIVTRFATALDWTLATVSAGVR